MRAAKKKRIQSRRKSRALLYYVFRCLCDGCRSHACVYRIEKKQILHWNPRETSTIKGNFDITRRCSVCGGVHLLRWRGQKNQIHTVLHVIHKSSRAANDDKCCIGCSNSHTRYAEWFGGRKRLVNIFHQPFSTDDNNGGKITPGELHVSFDDFKRKSFGL